MDAENPNAHGEVTRLLERLGDGDGGALEELVDFVYLELRRVAGGFVKGERSSLTLSATELVHEAYLRLFDPDQSSFQDRRHFFASAAAAMRRVLIDHARRAAADKRIPKGSLVPMELLRDGEPMPALGTGGAAVEGSSVDLLALDRLAAIDPRQARIVELRYFAGLTAAEVAQLLDISRSTVARDWNVARLWLRREMRT
ncbi:MAG: ECF-type sigma factor [Acidobacteriota bacterium]